MTTEYARKRRSTCTKVALIAHAWGKPETCEEFKTRAKSIQCIIVAPVRPLPLP